MLSLPNCRLNHKEEGLVPHRWALGAKKKKEFGLKPETLDSTDEPLGLPKRTWGFQNCTLGASDEPWDLKNRDWNLEMRVCDQTRTTEIALWTPKIGENLLVPLQPQETKLCPAQVKAWAGWYWLLWQVFHANPSFLLLFSIKCCCYC